MLRVGLKTDKGFIGVVGIIHDNVLRMRAGMPLDIDLKDMGPPGVRINRVYVHLSDTYEQTVDEMDEAGLPTNDALRETARNLDKQTKLERIANGRKQT